MTLQPCTECESYEKLGHNFCRMCGFDLRTGYLRKARLEVDNFANEKFCGYCGKRREECDCK